MPVGYHIGFRARDERVLAPEAGGRRAFAAVMKSVGRERGLYAFGLADRHGHAVLHGVDAPVAEFIQYAVLALRARLGPGVVGRVIREVRDGFHEESLIGYCHTQDVHHGSHLDPLREGTSLPDLFGLRPDGAWLAARVRELAPQLDRKLLLDQWGIPSLSAASVATDLRVLAECGAAAVGVQALVGRPERVRAARHACVEVAGPDARTSALAEVLGIDERTVRRNRENAADPRLVHAVRLQLGLRAVVRTQPSGFGEADSPRTSRAP